MYQQVRDAGAALAGHKAGNENPGNAEALAEALENLIRAAAERDPELADVVDEVLGNDAGEDEDNE